MRKSLHLILILCCFTRTSCSPGQATQSSKIDQDLFEISIPQLEDLYREHRYTVTEVTRWYLARIHRYNGIYRDIETLDEQRALATAARLDLEGPGKHALPMWGVPIVIKANTSIKGLVTTDGWKGYTLPGHELIAPEDATIVAKLRAAGAVILGHTNMPDFAASDTNRSSSFGRTGNAYDVRFSPGGSSGGTVTAVTSNQAVLGNGTDTGNSIRMPAATSAVVGLFPTRGLVSTAGIAPLDWLLDNTGPIARTVTDAAIALTVIAGSDSADPRTAEAASKAMPGPYTRYLKPDALKGKRFGVPAFVLAGAGIPFQGVCPEPHDKFIEDRKSADIPLEPDTRTAFLNALVGMRAAGATIVISDEILPDSFAEAASHICTLPYIKEGTDSFLSAYGPAEYHSAEQYAITVGSPLPDTILNAMNGVSRKDRTPIKQTTLEADTNAEAIYFKPRREALAVYLATLTRFRLDGFVYPATQMPPPDETMPRREESAVARTLILPGSTCLAFRLSLYPAASTRMDSHSDWSSLAARGATETCLATRSHTNSRRITEDRRFSSRLDFCRTPVSRGTCRGPSQPLTNLIPQPEHLNGYPKWNLCTVSFPISDSILLNLRQPR